MEQSMGEQAAVLQFAGTWAKLRRADPGDLSSPIVSWLSLEDHSADVAACALALLLDADNQPTLLNRRIAALVGLPHLDRTRAARIAVFAALHDIGKANHGFQGKAFPDAQLRAGHVGEVVPLIMGDVRVPKVLLHRFAEAVEWKTLEGWFSEPGAVASMLRAVVSHHGCPAEEVEGGFREALWTAQPQRDPLAAIAGLVAATKRWLPQAREGEGRLPAQPQFIHAIAGLVQIADWLGSDTDFFPVEDCGDRWAYAVPAARRAVDAVGLDGARYRCAQGEAPSFANISPHPPRPMQRAIADMSLPCGEGGSVVLIEDETGAGKTEAALVHFARLFHAGLVDGLYFALPTRTAATQMHARVRAAIRRLFPEQCCPACILAVPGYLRADDVEGRRLPGFEVLWPDRGEQRHRFWAAEHPKRYLAGTVVVGTIDQVLLSALAVDHSHLRAVCLLRHLLVVDEVHASDAYMSAVLAEVLQRHRAAGGHAVLVSATLGAAAAAALLGERSQPGWSAAVRMPYPLVRVACGTSVCVQPVEPLMSKPPIAIEVRAALGDAGVIAGWAVAAAARGARVLIVRNTVRGCLAVQRELERQADSGLLWRVPVAGGWLPAPHHARFAREDRECLDRAIEASFGREADRRGGMVCCATQTVQQSLDLDADFLITDICPMDVLLQRLGRLHRHRRSDRAAGFEDPRCLVLVPDHGPAELVTARGTSRVQHGLGSVYSDLAVIAATWEALRQRKRVAIPHDSRELVEAATHPEALQPWRTRSEAWRQHASRQIGAGIQHRQLARMNVARWDMWFDDPQVVFPSRHDERIMTRLGEGDRRVELLQAWRSPFGNEVRVVTIPAWLARAMPADAVVSITEVEGGIRLFAQGIDLVYDRLGLRSMVEQDTDDHADA